MYKVSFVCSKYVIILLSGKAYVIDSTDSQTATNGSTVTIEITAGGTPSDFTYQWMKNGVNISGETDSTLTISSFTTSDIGEYKCIPSNSLGSTNSSSTILSVNGKDINGKVYILICFFFFSSTDYKWVISSNYIWSSSCSS